MVVPFFPAIDVQAQQWQRALSLLEEMERCELIPNVISRTYTAEHQCLAWPVAKTDPEDMAHMMTLTSFQS